MELPLAAELAATALDWVKDRSSLEDLDRIRISRRWPHKFLPTLVSSWRAAGHRVSPALAYELELSERRNAQYRALAETLRSRVTRARAWKGSHIGDLYPAGIVRQQDDLDLCVTEEADAWAIATALVDDGWSLTGLSLVTIAGRAQPNLCLERASADPLHLKPDRVEVGPALLLGDYWRYPVRELPSCHPVVASFLLVLEERVDRLFGARDLFDLAVLTCHLVDIGRLPEAMSAAEQLGLVRPWSQARRFLVRALPGDGWESELPDLTPGRRKRGLDDLRWASDLARRPIRSASLAAAHAVRRHGSSSAARFLTVLQERTGGERLRRAGVPMHGVAIGPETSPSIRIVTGSGPAPFAVTPMGTFVLSAGGDIPSTWCEVTSEVARG